MKVNFGSVINVFVEDSHVSLTIAGNCFSLGMQLEMISTQSKNKVTLRINSHMVRQNHSFVGESNEVNSLISLSNYGGLCVEIHFVP